MLTVAIPKRNKLQNIIVLTPKDGFIRQNIPFYFLAFILEQVFLGYHLEYFRSLV